MSEWYCRVGQTELGPFTSQQLAALAREGRLRTDDLVRRSKDDRWSSASRVKGLFEAPSRSPPPIPFVAKDVSPASIDTPVPEPVARDLPPVLIITSRPMHGFRQVEQGSTFVRRSLIEGERVVYQARLHKWIFIRPFIFFIAVSIFGIFLIQVMMTGMSVHEREQYSRWKFLMGFVIPFLGMLVAFLVVWIRYRFTELAVTDKRVIGKSGFLNITSLELLLTKVEGIEVHQSFIGKLLDFGTITVSATGGSRTPFKDIAAPYVCRKAIQQQAALTQGG